MLPHMWVRAGVVVTLLLLEQITRNLLLDVLPDSLVVASLHSPELTVLPRDGISPVTRESIELISIVRRDLALVHVRHTSVPTQSQQSSLHSSGTWC